MPTTYRKKTNNTKVLSFTVKYQDAFDLAIVAGYLGALGFTNPGLIQAFEKESQGFTIGGIIYKTCVEAALADIRSDGAWYALALKTAKKSGSAIITYNVPISFYNEVQAFLASPTAQQILKGLADINHQSTTGITDGVKGVGKNIKEGLKDIGSGLGNSLAGGWDTMTSPVGSEKFKQGINQNLGGMSQAGKGYLKAGSQTLLDFVAFFGLKLISGTQTLLLMESTGRPIDSTELKVLQQIFGSSVEYDAIRIKTGYAGVLNAGRDNSWTLMNNNRAITIGNTIYMKNIPYSNTPASDWLSTLVHETTHVWQHQNGGTDYMGEALYAQATVGYGYANDIVANPPKTWFLLNPEQQGQLIEDAYINEYFHNGGWNNKKPVLYTTQNQTQAQISPQDMINYLNKVLPQIRVGQGAT